MKYNFDQIIDRRNTNCVKYDFNKRFGKPENIIPLWIADMDFKSPPAVSEALKKICDRGVYGYSEPTDTYFLALKNWFSRRFDWTPQPEWLLTTPGVVHALSTAIQALTHVGEAVLIQPPVYPPFAATIESCNRKLVTSPLVLNQNRYEMDYQDFEQKIINHDVKLFILCSPHNPVGRVWSKEELTRIGNICVKHHVYVVSDEIHADFVFPGNKHFIFASVKPEFADLSIICTAPSKTFNLAGLQTSNIFIPNPEIRSKFHKLLVESNHLEAPNIFGITACQTAYESGEDWLEELLIYLKENFDFVQQFLAEKLPQIKLISPDGCYLAWLDCRALNLTLQEMEELFTVKAGVWLNDGSAFGKEGIGFQRVNIACPRSVLHQAFNQIFQTIVSEN